MNNVRKKNDEIIFEKQNDLEMLKRQKDDYLQVL